MVLSGTGAGVSGTDGVLGGTGAAVSGTGAVVPGTGEGVVVDRRGRREDGRGCCGGQMRVSRGQGRPSAGRAGVSGVTDAGVSGADACVSRAGAGNAALSDPAVTGVRIPRGDRNVLARWADRSSLVGGAPGDGHRCLACVAPSAVGRRMSGRQRNRQAHRYPHRCAIRTGPGIPGRSRRTCTWRRHSPCFRKVSAAVRPQCCVTVLIGLTRSLSRSL